MHVSLALSKPSLHFYNGFSRFAERMNSGIGGVMARVVLELLLLDVLKGRSSTLPARLPITGLTPCSFRRVRLDALEGARITWLLKGEAVTTVPGVVVGGGTGLSVRKSGWMWDSDICGSLGLRVGVPALCADTTENAVGGRCSCDRIERAVGGLSDSCSCEWSCCWDIENSPSRVLAGLTGRLPGMGSSAVPLVGTARWIVSLIC